MIRVTVCAPIGWRERRRTIIRILDVSLRYLDVRVELADPLAGPGYPPTQAEQAEGLSEFRQAGGSVLLVEEVTG